MLFVRTVNLFSAVQIALTGVRFNRVDMRIRKKAERGEDNIPNALTNEEEEPEEDSEDEEG
jgi:hypothetical protein